MEKWRRGGWRSEEGRMEKGVGGKRGRAMSERAREGRNAERKGAREQEEEGNTKWSWETKAGG